MKTRTLAAAACLAALSTMGISQATTPPAETTPPTFEIADVHVTPHTSTPFMTGGALRGDRYILHNATMVDMVSLAYGISSDNVLSGPAWLDLNRFDVMARAPRTTTPDDLKLMLQAMLAERFHLVVHKDSKPVPSYVLSLDKGKPKLKEAANTSAPSGCEDHHTPANPQPGTSPYYSITCHNQTSKQIAETLQNYASNYLSKPVVDTTGLEGSWDFELAWTWRPAPDGLTIFDAVNKQLGLKLDLQKYPTPVVIVDSVNDKPTPNPPGIEKTLPPPPPTEFEVAVIKPSKPGTNGIQGRINGNQIDVTGATPEFLITFAWQIHPGDDELLVNAPKWIKEDRYDILAKASHEAQAMGPDGKPRVDFDLLPRMIQTLLTDRFQMKSHMEDRIVEAFTLVAANPKMKKADPLNRTGCKEGPGDDGKDPRIANPILSRLLTCRNMTMTQFAEQLQYQAGGYVFTPVLDSTGLTGAYDFTLSFSSIDQLHASPPPPPGSADAPSDPGGGLSLPDALVKQLGVKLVKEKRPSPVLVIDHIEQKPTDN